MASSIPNLRPEKSAARWLAEHRDFAASAVVVVGFAARLWAASGTFLNADEALHFRIANQPSLALVYRASLTESHPPLLYYVLHFLRFFGTGELWLRLPSIAAGTVSCWVLYRWMCQITMLRVTTWYGKGALPAFIAAIFTSLLPPVIRLSAEIRQYALLLAFLAGALYFLERALAKDAAWQMAASAVCLYLAMLSHYSALFFGAALSIYALLKILRLSPTRISPKITGFWIGSQAGALVLAIFLYKTHLSHLGHGESRTVLQGWMSEFYLSRSYFVAGRDNPLLFVIGHSFGVFQFIFGQLVIGDIAGFLFLAGIFVLWRGSLEADEGIEPESRIPDGRILGVFLVLLFGLACGASLAHLYPYGGTRHSSFLIIPAIAGVSVAIACLLSGRWNRSLAFALCVVVLSAIFGKQHQPYMSRADQSRTRMDEAMNFLRQNAAPGRIIFTDFESSMILGHYLCAQKPISPEISTPQFETFTCQGYRVVTANRTTATNFTPDVFLPLIPRFAAAYGLKPNDSFLIFQAGWAANLADQMRQLLRFHDLRIHAFGNNIKIFELTATEVAPQTCFHERWMAPATQTISDQSVFGLRLVRLRWLGSLS